MFIEPGTAGTDIDLMTMKALQGYRVTSGSPCIDAGLTIDENGGKDILGTPVVGGKADVGALERN